MIATKSKGAQTDVMEEAPLLGKEKLQQSLAMDVHKACDPVQGPTVDNNQEERKAKSTAEHWRMEGEVLIIIELHECGSLRLGLLFPP